MLAPSYSEALLMDPAPDHRTAEPQDTNITEMVPSYSEALLYQRAEQGYANDVSFNSDDPGSRYDLAPRECSCPCHTALEARVAGEGSRPEEGGQQVTRHPLMETVEANSTSCTYVSQTEAGRCGSCGKFLVEARLENEGGRTEPGTSSAEVTQRVRKPRSVVMPRDMSEPNLRSRSDLLEADTRFLRVNGQSLRNILESEQEEEFSSDERILEANESSLDVPGRRGKFRFSLSSLDEAGSRSRGTIDVSRGAIPKRTPGRSRVIANPMSNETCALPNSKTYFCLKSILKQNRRRYTLITAKELQNLSSREDEAEENRCKTRASYHEGSSGQALTSGGRPNLLSRSRESLDGALGRKKKLLLEDWGDKGEESASPKRENTR